MITPPESKRRCEKMELRAAGCSANRSVRKLSGRWWGERPREPSSKYQSATKKAARREPRPTKQRATFKLKESFSRVDSFVIRFVSRYVLPNGVSEEFRCRCLFESCSATRKSHASVTVTPPKHSPASTNSLLVEPNWIGKQPCIGFD